MATDASKPDPPVRNLRLDAQGRLASRVVCVGCRYSLRGLDPAGSCPECGLAIATSTRPTLLIYSDDRWLRRLRWGAKWAFVGLLIGVPYPIMFITNRPRLTGDFTPFLLAIALLLPFIQGVWHLTAREPLPAVVEPRLSARRIARIAVLVAFANAAAFPIAFQSAIFPWLVPLLFFTTGVAGVALGRALQQLFLRAAEPINARHTARVTIAFALSSVQGMIAAAMHVLLPLMGVAEDSPVEPWLNLLFGVSVLTNFVALLFAMVLLGNLHKVLQRELE